MAGLIAGCRAEAQPKVATTGSTPAAAQTAKVIPPPASVPTDRDLKVLPPPTALQVPPGPPPQAFGTPPQPALENFLKFETEMKEVSVTNGTPEAHFAFNLTNISSGPVMINYVQTSCGCTVAKLPSQPWKLMPNDHGEISATMQLAGTPPGASKTKTLTVNTDHGSKLVLVKATILPDVMPMSEMDRTKNVMTARADRQAVFKGDCIQCHVAPAKDSMGHDKMGQELYAAVCGVCHEAEHQASFVPNLHRLAEPTSAEFWRNWILHGKPGTLMPAFAKSEGGILTDEQTESLVRYLTATIPAHPVVVPAPAQLQVK
jgi:mono/diheme cytochrome c family protein